MAGSLVVCGYGPGISDAVARTFGARGFSVTLVARDPAKVEAGAATLRDAGIPATGIACDLGDPAAVRAMVATSRGVFGPVTVLHYNAYADVAGDLLTADLDDVRRVYDVGIVGLVAALQAALPDLSAQRGRSAVLVTGGGFGLDDDAVARAAVDGNAMGLSLAKADQHKLVALLHHRLEPEGVYVGEVVVMDPVAGTAWDDGSATLTATDVAAGFWSLYEHRREPTARLP